MIPASVASRSTIPVSAPPRVHERLRDAPEGPVRVLHRGPHAIYLDVHGWCVGVLAAGAALVPCALRSRLGTLEPVSRGPAYLRAGVLHLDGTRLAVGRIDAVATPYLDPGALVSDSLPPGGILRADEVAAMVGAGEGLTPFGDDVLCGWLATHRAARLETPLIDRAVRALLPRTTLLSATLLDCALHGEVLPEFAAYLAALGTEAEPGAAAALAAVGHTSGAGLLLGARRALAEIRASIGLAA